MHRRETERLLVAIRQAQAAPERVALATVVRVKGSAYRREGTRMLVRQNGTYECALSGGCLEPSVAEAALRVIETGEPADRQLRPGGRLAVGSRHGLQRRRGRPHRAPRRRCDDARVADGARTRRRGGAGDAALRSVGTGARSRNRRDRRRPDRFGGRAGGDRSRPRRAPCAVPAIRPRADRRQRSVLRDQHAAARARDLRRRTRRRAAGAAGLDARFCRDRRRCPHGVPDGGSLSRRHAGVRAFQSVRRHGATRVPAASCS